MRRLPGSVVPLTVSVCVGLLTLSGCAGGDANGAPPTAASGTGVPTVATSGPRTSGQNPMVETSLPASTVSPSASALDPTRQAVVDAAALEVQAYLDSWRDVGVEDAGRKYLSPDQQVTSTSTPTSAGALLVGGRVAGVRLQSWTSSDHFVLLADLDLVFRADAATLGNWANGRNERFITFTRRSGDVPYALSFATSP